MSNSDVNQQAGNVLPVVQGRMLSQPSTDGNPVLQQVPVAVMMPMKQDEPQDEDELSFIISFTLAFLLDYPWSLMLPVRSVLCSLSMV